MKKFISIFSCFISLLSSCAEADLNAPYGSKVAPANVTVKEIVNRSGGAVIYYNIPDDQNLKYIRAVYTPRENEPTEIIASLFTDSLVVEGFEKAGEQIVKLSSVSFGGTESEPLQVKISPQKPPYLAALDEMTITQTYGGFDVKSSNPTGTSLLIFIYSRGEDGELNLVEEISTKEEEIFKAIRKQKAEPMEIVVQIKDYWGNTSDYKTASVTPLYEELVDASLFEDITLTGDTPIHDGSSYNKAGLWDGVSGTCQWMSPTGFPAYITFDMGQTYLLTRFDYWPRNAGTTTYNQLYQDTDIKKFQMYGALELNSVSRGPLFDEDGALNPEWILLGTFENKRESGAEQSAEYVALSDIEKSNLTTMVSRSFNFEEPLHAVRYLRICTLMSWGNNQQSSMGTMDLYGQPR